MTAPCCVQQFFLDGVTNHCGLLNDLVVAISSSGDHGLQQSPVQGDVVTHSHQTAACHDRAQEQHISR